MPHASSFSVLVLAAALLAAVLCGNASAADEPVGYVAAVEGSAVIQRAADELPAARGTVVNDDDRLQTHAESRLLVVLDSGSRIVVGPDSTVALSGLIAPRGADGRIIRIIEGIMRIGIGDEGDDGLQTVSPTAIAAARSTEWIIEYANDSTAVLALEGRVAVAGVAGGEVLLEPGLGTDVPAGAPPSEPRTWGEARAADARMRTALGAP